MLSRLPCLGLKGVVVALVAACVLAKVDNIIHEVRFAEVYRYA